MVRLLSQGGILSFSDAQPNKKESYIEAGEHVRKFILKK
jgi:hypothetical protein